MSKISSKYIDVVLKASIISVCLSSERNIIKAAHITKQEKSATKEPQLVPIGIPTTCLYNLVPNRMNMLSNKRSAHHIQFDKTMHGILSAVLKFKKTPFCRYMQGKESFLFGRFFKFDSYVYL